jgi:hypothetical protein
MDTDERQHLKNLRKTTQRRLHKLEEQAAEFGVNTPPEIKIEIEDLRGEIDRLNAQITEESTIRTQHLPPRRWPLIVTAGVLFLTFALWWENRLVFPSPNTQQQPPATVVAGLTAPIITSNTKLTTTSAEPATDAAPRSIDRYATCHGNPWGVERDLPETQQGRTGIGRIFCDPKNQNYELYTEVTGKFVIFLRAQLESIDEGRGRILEPSKSYQFICGDSEGSKPNAINHWYWHSVSDTLIPENEPVNCANRHTVKIEVKDDEFSIYVDGDLLYRTRDSHYATGVVAIGAWSNNNNEVIIIHRLELRPLH